MEEATVENELSEGEDNPVTCILTVEEVERMVDLSGQRNVAEKVLKAAMNALMEVHREQEAKLFNTSQDWWKEIGEKYGFDVERSGGQYNLDTDTNSVIFKKY